MSESWDTVTAYGNVDMTLHPVLRRAYRVACLIERCGASPELTAASSAAFDLCGEIASAIESLQARVRDLQQYHDWAAPQIERPVEQSVIAENNALSAKLAEAETAIKRHNDACQDQCGRGDQEAVACKYRPYFENNGRRCTTCPRYNMIDYPAAIAAGGDDAKD